MYQVHWILDRLDRLGTLDRIDRTDRIHRIDKKELDSYRMEQNRIDKYDVEPSMTYAYAYMTLHLHNQQVQEYQ